jgi:hypothetical protein
VSARAGRGRCGCGGSPARRLARTLGRQYEIGPVEDGRVILTPKLTAEARHARLGGRALTQEEFEAEFGDLPTGPA